MNADTPPHLLRRPTHWLMRHAAMAVALVALADWLFYDAVFPGLSLALFFAACVLVTTIANPLRARGPIRLVASAAFALALLAIGENLSALSFFVASSATTLFALVLVSGSVPRWSPLLWRATVLPFVGGFWLVGDVLRARKLSLRRQGAPWRIAALAGWITPVLFSIVFVTLFASANPLIDEWVLLLDPSRLLDLVSGVRVAFWLVIASLVWPYVHLRRGRRGAPTVSISRTTAGSNLDVLAGGPAILRSLVLFNALFAVQTALDIAYLWGGLELPHDLTYAAYAHRGAYPLLATALLAAAFVLIAMRPGGPAESFRWIRPLVLLWVAQNFLLVLSSMFRTGLYVKAYSLSELRLAAMIWMGLVAFGLILIVVQIAWRKSKKWLLNANVAAAVAVIYAVCFMNFPYIVASYNVTHCHETSGEGPALDLEYLFSLGAQAMPAYDAFRRAQGEKDVESQWSTRRSEAAATLPELSWRNWSFRGWRLRRYFDTFDAARARGEWPAD